MKWHLHKWHEERAEIELVKHIDYGRGKFFEIREFVRYPCCTICGKTKRKVDFTQRSYPN